jgi:hypothetical protein
MLCQLDPENVVLINVVSGIEGKPEGSRMVNAISITDT